KRRQPATLPSLALSMCPGVRQRIATAASNIPGGGRPDPAPKILFGKIPGRIFNIFDTCWPGRFGQDPSPSHGVLAVVTAYPSVRPKRMVRLAVHGLPDAVSV